MTEGFERAAQLVSGALKRSAVSVDRLAPDRWKVIARNGHVIEARARLDGRWALIEAPVKERGRLLWDLAKFNACLEAPVKFALARTAGTPSLRAEIAIHEGADLARRVHEALGAMQRAATMTEPKMLRAMKQMFARRDEPPPAGEMDLPALCSDTGLDHTRRDDGSVTFNLPVTRGFHTARVFANRAGVSVTTEVLAEPGLSPQAKRAIAVLLLRVNARVRFARGSAEETESHLRAVFETVFASAPAAAELRCALDALAIASDVAREELRAMRDPSVAQSFLKAQRPGRECAARRTEQLATPQRTDAAHQLALRA